MATNLETESGKVGRWTPNQCQQNKSNADRKVEVLQPITVGGQNVDDVDRFTYLGSILACDGDAEADGNCRIGKAAQYSKACGRYGRHQ